MRSKHRRKILQYLRLNHYRSIWKKFVRVMACIVVFCTTYALILPAITMEQVHFCGLDEHEHGESCYSHQEKLVFTCVPGQEEFHVHEDRCFDAQGLQLCPYEELTEHAHEESCYEDGSLICGMEEVSLHIHTEDCVDENGVVICELPEYGFHEHSDACIVLETEEMLVCTQTVHVHDASCDSDPDADVEEEADWVETLRHAELTGRWRTDLVSVAKSQMGYQESVRNYLLDAEGVQNGYTRYGAWYGVPYGQWDAMFVSFCLHYAQIPQDAIPWESDSAQWLEALRERELTGTVMDKVPETGDLLFYTTEDSASVRSAIVVALEVQADEDGQATYLQLMEGNLEDQVLQRRVRMDSLQILGCCGIDQVQQRWDAIHGQAAEETTAAAEPIETTQETENTEGTVSTEETTETTEAAETEETTEATEATEEVQLISQCAETENYIVTVTYSSDLIQTEGAQLRVFEYSKDSEIFRQRCEEAGYELEWLLNIGFFVDEQELELDGAFEVLVTSKQGEGLGQDITHFTEEGAQRITGEDASGHAQEGLTAVSFPADGFSDFGGGVAVAAETSPGISTFAVGDLREADAFNFVTMNPSWLEENTDYAIYVGAAPNFYFLGSSPGSNGMMPSVDANNTGLYYSPTNIGSSWSLTAAQMGTTFASNFTWRLVEENNRYYLESQKNGQRLTLSNNSVSLTDNGSALTFSVNGATMKITSGNSGLQNYYGWRRSDSNNATSLYIAQVTPAYRNYPDAVYTGDVHVDRLRFYNICEGAESGVTALAGCVFQIEGTTENGQPYSSTIVSDNSPQIALPSDIPDGRYTIKEVSAPEGYMRDLNHTREFWIKDGALESEHNIGIFLNHSLERLTVGKTGEVEDYNNRIYQILLDARTNLRMYQMDPIEVLFVVDKSNSMLFPSGMEPTGKQITLRSDGQNNVWNNRNVLNSLDQSKMHYIIADPNGTSTVYAVWYDGTAWLYQDASYYAKAKFNNGDGYGSTGETVIFPGDRSYSDQSTWEDNTYGEDYRSNGGGLNHSMSGCTLGNYINDNGGTVSFQLYTAQDQYNRLHYLEEALANMIYELADANHENKVTLIPFTKEVQKNIYYPLNTNNAVSQPVTLTTTNANMLYDIVTHIDTSGGTRQDLALEYAYEQYLDENDGFDKAHTYTILITDGAPVRSGSSAPALGSPNSAATTADNGDIYGRIKGWGGKVREESTLMTVALGMEFVEGGRQVLQNIASSDDFYCALDDASALTENMQKILFDGMRDQGELRVDNGQIVDEITDSFYAIAWTEPGDANGTGRTVLNESNGKAWLLIQEGDWITLEGKFTTAGASDAAGQLMKKDDGTYYIQWQNQTISGSGWKGTFYVKAKEDFIGGNAIDTNKSARVIVNDATKTMATPTVNVHLLEMNQNRSEVTVYLGDIVNSNVSSPRGSLRGFYEKIAFSKILDESQIPDPEKMNRLDPDGDPADGLERNYFLLKYALGYENAEGTWVPRELTSDEWTTLESGGTLTIPYTYDNASSHGDVGYFTIRLNKTSDSYRQHEATTACQPGGQPLTEDCESPAETYTLTVTYTAYELGEQGRPGANVNNGTGSPGTEVTKAAKGINNGQGIITSENIHEVHVISGKIVVEKIFTEGTEWTAGDTFTFQLTRQDGVSESQTVTIGADGTATATFDFLRRGTYTVTEAVSEDYAVKSVTVGNGTNAYYTQPDPMQVSFTMGNNLDNENVIGLAAEGDAYTSYIDPVNGVYGEAVFANAPRIYTGEVPVEKIWDDGVDVHEFDAVYLALYLDDQPVLDTDGCARLLRVDAASNWEDVFTVVLANKNDTVDNYNYSVREVGNISTAELHGWQRAILENDGETVLYYDKALPEGGLLGVAGKGYIVKYSTAEDGTHVVTNYESVVLPVTGGMGTHLYTFSGLAVLAAALMYGYSLRRKRERGASG